MKRYVPLTSPLYAPVLYKTLSRSGGSLWGDENLHKLNHEIPRFSLFLLATTPSAGHHRNALPRPEYSHWQPRTR